VRPLYIDGTIRREAASIRAVQTQLPSLARLDELAPLTAQLVLRLNRIGAATPDPVLASMYRTLVRWPGSLALA
jgi:hypothetical protein